jgi:hypothetical protein
VIDTDRPLNRVPEAIGQVAQSRFITNYRSGVRGEALLADTAPVVVAERLDGISLPTEKENTGCLWRLPPPPVPLICRDDAGA